MARIKQPLIISGVHQHRDNLRVDLTLSDGTRKRVTVGEYTDAAKVAWSKKRAVIKQQIDYGLFRWQDWFTPEQWGAGGGESQPKTMAECGEDFFDQLTGRKPQTIDVMRSRWRKWSELHDKRVERLLPGDIGLAMRKGGIDKLAPNSQRAAISVLRQVLEYAARNERIPFELLDRLSRELAERCPDRPTADVQHFQPEEVERLLATMRDHFAPWLHNYFEFMFFSGLRPCEARALLWSDIDLKTGIIRVERAKYAAFDEGEPKTRAGKRTFKLATRALAAIQRQRALTQLAGGLVFKHPTTGGHIDYHKDHDGVTGRWYEAVEMAGVPALRPYSTRHTFASMCYTTGMRLGQIARLLGHTNAEFTAKTYATWISSKDDEDEMAKLDRFVPISSPASNM